MFPNQKKMEISKIKPKCDFRVTGHYLLWYNNYKRCFVILVHREGENY